jgi:hypothetical protein
MSAGYNFYIQSVTDYEDDTLHGELDIEETFNCKYCSFTGLGEDGAARVYTEEFAEAKELRVYTPAPSEITHDSTECKLTLLFESDKDFKVQEDERRFQEYVAGRKIIYHDTFRNLYYSLLMKTAPTKNAERLYSGQQYRQVVYTFTNLAGCPYKENPLTKK